MLFCHGHDAAPSLSYLHVKRKLHYHCVMKSVYSLIAVLILGLSSALAYAQESRETLEGSWEGPLVVGRDNMTMAFTFSLNEGDYRATLTSGGLGIFGMPVTTISVEGRDIVIRIPRLDLEFTGTIRRDQDTDRIIRIDGDWFQYSEMVPVVLLPVDEPSF